MAITKILPKTKYRNIIIEGETFEGEEYRPSIGMWVRFKANLKLYVISLAVRGENLPKGIARQIWEMQDGMPGVPPEECEWDWSAIRDSSQEAIDEMYAVASQYIDVPGLSEILVSAAVGK